MSGDLVALQGSWSITKLEIEGQPMPAAGRITIKGSRFTTESMGSEYKGQVTAADGQIDLAFTSGPERGKTSFGIYKLKGDTLQICLSLTATERPTRFRTTEGSGLALETLVRDHADRAAEPPVVLPEKLEPVPELEGEWQMLSCLMGGKPLPKEYVEHGRRLAAKNEVVVQVMEQTMMHAHITVDRSTTPLEIDYYLHGKGKKLALQRGIWNLMDGVLTTCSSAPGQPRPTSFEPNPGVTVSTWRKVTEG